MHVKEVRCGAWYIGGGACGQQGANEGERRMGDRHGDLGGHVGDGPLPTRTYRPLAHHTRIGATAMGKTGAGAARVEATTYLRLLFGRLAHGRQPRAASCLKLVACTSGSAC
jgi:hypothetical protein